MNLLIDGRFSVVSACVTAAVLIGYAAPDEKKQSQSQLVVEANIDTAESLYYVPGIGPATAAKIMKERDLRAFSGCDDFSRRLGITRSPTGFGLAQMSERGLRVNGETCR
ncbi:hypothetical protein [Polaromonas jejuensis]|uniref:Helix-hairpin-helix domain-containing protein n=1 Tax=Polaromonas jejuensis TaxID=457502 RepID=A0ABW0QAQ1_9BURK|nr:hypothetical protein [Polaromonas jejuensis]